MNETLEEKENFRDSLGIVSSDGKRNWIYPKKPSGRFYTVRTVFSLFLLLVLFVTPFIKKNGQPFILLNIIERNFILFGIPFGPHDFHLFVIAMISVIVFIILFTVVFGRVFCGWVCPQTVFLEMVYRKIEYIIEGNANKQRQLDNEPMSGKKFLKKGLKHSIFFSISFLISNIFLAYIIGIDALAKIITDPPSAHAAGLLAIIIFSGIFYWVFAFFREQACILVCPYGRLQGVLLDRDSIVIAYDHVRGEPRGIIRKNDISDSKGDCIDCSMCVDVCPTGIDIRNGIQLECVNCTACIDACDEVMDKVKRPRGLIKYASVNNIEKHSKFRLSPRIISYSIVLLILLSVLGLLMNSRTDYDINIFRTPGLLYQEQPDNKVSNLYDLNIVNKTYNKLPVTLKLENINGEIKIIGNKIFLNSQDIADSKFMIILPKEEIHRMNTPVIIAVYSDNILLGRINSSFLGPVKEKHDE
jgi:cytochrome c oxidase accessory protein FixG